MDFDRGGRISIAAANEVLARTLTEIVAKGATSVIVEDDLARRGDPAISRKSIPSAFVDDRVLHWCELPPDSIDDAVFALRQGSSGYPLNAFITRCAISDLGLAANQTLDDSVLVKVVESLVAIVVAAFDAESFLIWGLTT